MNIAFKLALLICLQLLTTFVSGQKQNNIWYFGRHAGLDFNTTPPTPLEGPMEAIEGCASIADPTGKLLFFTNGITVWDRNLNVMPNGNGLIGGPTSTQAALIVPFPNSNYKYYIFTTEDEGSPQQRLSYSIVDIRLNAGFGDVIQATKNTIVETETAEKLNAVLHSNGVDVWIITHKLNSSEFLSFLLTSTGLNTTPVVSPIGSNHPHLFTGGGVGPIRSNHKGSKIVCADTFKKIFEMFDFNHNTGILSNVIDLNQLLSSDQQYIYGVEFSPNDSLLYVSTETGPRLYQIQVSSLTVTDLAHVDNDGFEVYDALQLGPDNKIYMARGTRRFLDVINFPDQPGIACQYEEQGILLDSSTTCIWGLPAFAAYSFPLTSIPSISLGSDTTLCDGETVKLNVEFPTNCDSTSISWNNGATTTNIIVSQPGQYWVIIESSCGSYSDTIQVDYVSCLPIVSYDLEACTAYMSNGSNMDYSEFTPTYPNELQCADITASNVFRTPPLESKHSCTPGVGDSIAMCISSYNSCSYIAGQQASLIMEVVINPIQDSAVRITGLEFYEKAPNEYNWINGGSGPNNFPKKYGLRILKNGTEIFREYLLTKADWTLEKFDFLQNDNFLISDSSFIRIELLPYCPVGNGADVSAWDIDEIKIFGTCGTTDLNKSVIKGIVLTKDGQPVPGVDMKLSGEPLFLVYKTQTTNGYGTYQFDHLKSEQSYYLQGYKNDDVRKGVTTLDLILIQKHLLGITPFTSLDQYIASDINHDDRVNALDLLELRKLLLGMYSEFPKNTSWRFGYLPQNTNGSNIKDFHEVKSIENLGQDTLKVDFVGIKIGDVNGDIH